MEVNTTEVFPPLLPSCLEGRLDGAFTNESAQNFDPTSWEYYKNEVLPEAIAGFVFGVLAFLLFLVLLGWILYKFRCCCPAKGQRCCSNKAKAPSALPGTASQDQFITTSPTPSPTDAPQQVVLNSLKSTASDATEVLKGDAPATGEKPTRCTNVLKYLIVFFALLTFGLCLWGIPASFQQTDSQIDAFWDLFDDIYEAQNNTVMELKKLSEELAIIKSASQTISEDSGSLFTFLMKTGKVGEAVITEGLNAIQKVSEVSGTAEAALSDVVNQINEAVGESVQQIEDEYKSKTMQFQVRGRIALIAILLGVILLGVPIAAWLCWDMKHPVWAASIVAALLFVVCFVLIIGAGVARSLVNLSNDGCLYAEQFIGVTVLTKVKDEKKRKWLYRAMSFYLNPVPPGELDDSAFVEITGVDLSPLMDVLQSNALGTFYSVVDSNVVGTLFNFIVEDDTSQAIQDLATVTQPTITTIKNIDYYVSRNTTFPLYLRGKELICCEAGHSAKVLFAGWTTIGAVTFAFALMCTWRIISHQRKVDKERAALKTAQSALESGEMPAAVDGAGKIVDSVTDTPETEAVVAAASDVAAPVAETVSNAV